MSQMIQVNATPNELSMPTLFFSQGDVGRTFQIEIVSSDGYSIPSGATVKINATKPSGFGFSVSGTVSNNTVTFTSTTEMTDEAGRFLAELEITSGANIIGTANFYMSGEVNPHPEGTTDGSQETIIPQLTLLVERVENAAAAVLDTTTVATTLPAGSQATYSFDEETNTATFGIPQGEAGAGAAGVVASAYSASKTYAVGDYAIHNSNLYRCTTAIATAESFTAEHWTQVVLADDVTDLKSDLNAVYLPLNFEIGVNRFVNDGTIATANNVARASVAPMAVPNSKKIFVQIEGSYTVNVLYREDGVWTDTAMQSSNFSVDLSTAELFAVQVAFSTTIPSDAIPCRIVANLPTEIDKLDYIVEESLNVEIGVNRFLNGTSIAVSTNSQRASIAPFKVKYKEFVVKPLQNYYFTIFRSHNNTAWEELQVVKEQITITVDDGDYICIQILPMVNTQIIPQDAKPISMYYIDVFNLIADDINKIKRLSINADIEIGVNRFLSNGKLVRAINERRASTAPSPITYSTLYVRPQGYTINFFVQRGDTWEQAVADATESFSYTFTNEIAYAFQVLSNTAIPQDAVPFTIGFNLPSALKKVADIASQTIPSGLSQYDYKGEAISVSHKIAYEQYMTISTETSAVVQGCTAYGKYLFVAYNTLPMISIYDMEQKLHVANIQMTAVDTYHCNNINFGSEKYDSGDAFPLLYVSMENIAEHKALVFRIQESNGTYSATLVQTITYPNPSEVGMYYPNCVVDAVNNRLCVMGYSTNSYVKSASNKIKVDIYDLPLLSAGNIQLDRANAKNSIEVKSLTATQGAFVNGDNIVQVYGLPNVDGVTFIGQLSLSGGAYTTLINLTEIGLTVEPESVFVYDNGIYILFVDRTVYRVYLA